MQYKAYDNKKVSDLGVKVVTFVSIATMSTIMPLGSMTSTLNQPYAYEGVSLYNDNEGDICSSFGCSDGLNGDIIANENVETDFVSSHEKINVKINVIQVKNHVSNFDFEDEYEEI